MELGIRALGFRSFTARLRGVGPKVIGCRILANRVFGFRNLGCGDLCLRDEDFIALQIGRGCGGLSSSAVAWGMEVLIILLAATRECSSHPEAEHPWTSSPETLNSGFRV